MKMKKLKPRRVYDTLFGDQTHKKAISSQQLDFDSLSIKLKCKILMFLSVTDLNTCSIVSKEWQDLVTRINIWKHFSPEEQTQQVSELFPIISQHTMQWSQSHMSSFENDDNSRTTLSNNKHNFFLNYDVEPLLDLGTETSLRRSHYFTPDPAHPNQFEDDIHERNNNFY